jgi:hypothetical protein
MVFITSQSVLEHANHGHHSDAQRFSIVGCRFFIYLLSMTQLMYTHLRDCIQSYRQKNTTKVLGFVPIPNYLFQWQDAAGFFLTIALMTMLTLEPLIWCWNSHETLMDSCDERDGMYFYYKLFTMVAMFLYYIMLIDLTVLSTSISAFVLVCVRVVSEVGLFLGALAACILTFSSAISVLKQESPDFAGIHVGSYALFRMVLGMYDSSNYGDLEEEPAVLAVVFVFLIGTMIFLMSLLVAQLSCAYSAVYDDMVGYARLKRGQIIVEIMPSISKKRWNLFMGSLRLHKRIEFNEGDVGVAGGLQVKEPASANPTTIDMIRRFGGSTSVEMQWPEEDNDGDGEDRFERLEKLIQRTLQRVTKSDGHAKGKGSSQGGSGTGTGLSGSNSDEKMSDDGED